MAFITEGILQRKLPWTLVLLGASISLVLELCGVPSLAFAVGVYLPLSTSSPIFVGGLVRYVADKWGRSKPGADAKETDSDTSSGVLLSTGYIAGGAIAGILIAFLSVSPDVIGVDLPKILSTWQFRSYQLPREMPLDDAFNVAAESTMSTGGGEKTKDQQEELKQITGEIEEMNGDLQPRYLRIPAGTKLALPERQPVQVTTGAYLGDIAKAELGSEDKAQTIMDMNLDRLIEVPAKTTLKLPKCREDDPPTYEVKEKKLLGDVAMVALGDIDKAQKLFELNKDVLAPKVTLPVNAQIKLPQRNWPALVSFGVLVAFLLVVGLGRMLKSGPMHAGEAGADKAV